MSSVASKDITKILLFLDKNREEIVSVFPILPLTQISLNPGRTRLIPL
jgi:hypothetical protein